MKQNDKDYETLKTAYEELQAAFDARETTAPTEVPIQGTSVSELSDDDVRAFFTAYPSAKEEAASLADNLARGDSLDKTALYAAYIAVLLSKVSSPDALASDDQFLKKYVYSSPKVNQHFEECFGGTRPAVLKGVPSMVGSRKIRTLADAAEVARQLL